MRSAWRLCRARSCFHTHVSFNESTGILNVRFVIEEVVDDGTPPVELYEAGSQVQWRREGEFQKLDFTMRTGLDSEYELLVRSAPGPAVDGSEAMFSIAGLPPIFLALRV